MQIGVKLEPVSANFTLKGHIYDMLRSAILELNIYDNDANLRLDERELAEQSGISRTPIREALAKLEHEGLVEIRPRKGVFVRRKSLLEILEMIVVWSALESMAARLATEKASDDELASLRKLGTEYSLHSARADIAEYSEANITFHQRILEMSKCSLIASMADSLFEHMYAVRRRAMGESNRAKRSVVDHMGIIEALEDRDADLAACLVREHTMRLHDHVRSKWLNWEQGSEEAKA